MSHKRNGKFLTEAIANLLHYLDQDLDGDDKVLEYLPPAELRQKMVLKLDDDGISEDQLLTEIKQITQYSVNTCHPLYLNQLSGGPNQESLIGEFLCAVLNPTMSTYEVSPAATLIEKALISRLNRMIGYKSDEGIMVTGGSNGNMIGLLCARNKKDVTNRTEGKSNQIYKIYVSEDAHYSFEKAANICGVGTQNVRSVPVDDQGSMSVEALEKMIGEDISAGHVPLMVGATAGTTVFGAFDPIMKIAKITQAHNIWFHVDAAWGGGCLFSKKLCHHLEGAQLADSVSLDGHKALSTGLITSFFLSKHKGILKFTNSGGGSEYLFHEHDHVEFDSGTYSLQCGRRADALKLWILWRSRGTSGLGEMIDHQFDLAEYARKKVQADSRFSYITSHYLNVCFQVKPIDKSASANDLTLQVRTELVQSGKALVNYATNKQGLVFFRLVFPNARTTRTDIDILFDYLIEISAKIEEQKKNAA